MIRFFVKPDKVVNGVITLSTEDSEHIRSLRLRPDELFVVCDGNGLNYICNLGEPKQGTDVQEGVSTAYIIKQEKVHSEPSVKCSVYIAYAKGERLDYAVQKSVELGALRIVLYESARCIAFPNNVMKKTERLQKIAMEAAKQSGRGIIPEVSSVGSFSNMVDMAATYSDLAMMCYEEEHNLHIMTVLEHFFPTGARVIDPKGKVKSVAIITGPEGGFEPGEAKLAEASGISVISLGPRILRSETAPVTALSVLMYHTGNL